MVCTMLYTCTVYQFSVALLRQPKTGLLYRLALYTGGRSAPVFPPFLSLRIVDLVCGPPAVRDHRLVRRMRRMAGRRIC